MILCNLQGFISGEELLLGKIPFILTCQVLFCNVSVFSFQLKAVKVKIIISLIIIAYIKNTTFKTEK